MSELKATTIKATTTDDASQKTTILLNGTTGLVRAGSYGQDGELQLMPSSVVDGPSPIGSGTSNAIGAAQATILLSGENAHVRIGGGAGTAGTIATANPGQNGRLTLRNSANAGTGVLDGRAGDLWLGGEDTQHAPLHFAASAGELGIGGGKPPASSGPTVLTGANGGLRV